MTDYAQHLMEHLRLNILRALSAAPASQANASILKSVAQQYGLNVTRDQVHTAIGWLADQGLVMRSTAGELVIATLTEAGLDVAEGRRRVDGVQRLGLAG